MATGGFVLLSVWISVGLALNLDTRFPVLKTGREGSLFGLSVALHQDLRTDSYLLLVGAPREKAEPNIPANRTGGVYSCPITADQSECIRMKLIDPVLDVNLSEDLIEDMWLGVAVASQGPPGGQVLVCGHRFIKLYGAYKLRHMTGRCFLRRNDLQYNATDWQSVVPPCRHRGDVSAEVMCNMGISAAITGTEVIVGTPGSYDWQGNVHVSWRNPDDVFYTRETSFNNMGQRNIYIGYSVVQSRGLLSQEEETIVTGAPKDSKADARGSVLLAVKTSGRLLPQETLRGQQTGSYFGNAVATVDLNSDGWKDLLVGAPFYFYRQEVGGAVYVYLNSGGQFDSQPSMVLTGPAGSAFGMSVAAMGDLDQDGFQDFAVGAPFHDSGSVMIWTGSSKGISREPSQVVRGSSISPGFRTFGYSLAGGVDVDGNRYPDLLVGSLDDTVALLRARPVVHLNRTLRVAPLVVDPNSCDFCIQVEVCFSYMFAAGQMSDSDVTVLFTVSADVTSLKSRLHFHDNGQSVFSGRLSMPKQRCEALRVGLQSPVRDKVEPLLFSLNVSLYEELPGKRNVVQDLKPFPVLSETPQPLTTQIHIQKACGSDNRCHSNLQMTAQFSDENLKPFPRHESSQVWRYTGRNDQLILEVNVSNIPSLNRPAEDAHNAVLNISIPPLLIYSAVRSKGDVQGTVQCSVEGEILFCDLGSPFKHNQEVWLWIVFQPSETSFDTGEVQTLLQLLTLSDQSDLPRVSVSLLVEHSPQASITLISPPGPAYFSGHVMGESAMMTTEDIGSLLLFTFQVHIEGKHPGRRSDLQVEFEWPMEASSGKWLLYLTEIQVMGASRPFCSPPILNPLNLTVTKESRRWRRSLEDEETKEVKDDQGDKPLPFLHLQGPKKSFSLVWMLLEQPNRGHSQSSSSQLDQIFFNQECVDGAHCVMFICPLDNIKNSATLTVRARLWNSTMIEDYGDAKHVIVRGRATLKTQSNKTTISTETHSTQFEVHIYPESQEVESSTPLWIFVVSVLAGVLLLALICLLLWKCSFFRRASTRELYEAKTQKAQLKSQPSDSEWLDQDH